MEKDPHPKTLSEPAGCGMNGSTPWIRGQSPIQAWKGRVCGFFYIHWLEGLKKVLLYCILCLILNDLGI